jgi:hypothetical protein
MVAVKFYLGGSSIGIIIQQLHICPLSDMAMSSTLLYEETLCSLSFSLPSLFH